MQVSGKLVISFTLLALLVGCSTPQKEIKFTYAKAGTVSVSELEGARRDFRGKGLLAEEAPSNAMLLTYEEIVEHIQNRDVGEWELVDDEHFMSNVYALCDMLFGGSDYVTEDFMDGMTANHLIGTDYYVRLLYTSNYHYYVIGLKSGVE